MNDPLAPPSEIELAEVIKTLNAGGLGFMAKRIRGLAYQRDMLKAELERPRLAKELVDRQAEDAGLWFVAETAPEGHLQRALRKLHAVIEGDAVAEAKEE